MAEGPGIATWGLAGCALSAGGCRAIGSKAGRVTASLLSAVAAVVARGGDRFLLVLLLIFIVYFSSELGVELAAVTDVEVD